MNKLFISILAFAALALTQSYALTIEYCDKPDQACTCHDNGHDEIHGICRAWYNNTHICDCVSINHFYDCATKEAGKPCTCMKGTPDALTGVCTEGRGKADPKHPRYKKGDVYCNCDDAYQIKHDEL
jgi:hypothetical protein